MTEAKKKRKKILKILHNNDLNDQTYRNYFEKGEGMRSRFGMESIPDPL